MPLSLTLAEPVTMDPPQAHAILATSILSLPAVASNVTITAGQSITLTLPVSVSPMITQETYMTNTASFSYTFDSDQDSITITVSGSAPGPGTTPVYLPIVLKS